MEKFCRISKFTLHNSFSVQKLHTTRFFNKIFCWGRNPNLQTYCLIIKNDNYINGFIREPIRHVVINPKKNNNKKFINIIIQSLNILFLEIILILKTIICVMIQIGNINKTITFTI